MTNTLHPTLIPVSHPQFGAINITERLFAIGSNESMFAGFESTLVSRLDARHARLVVESETLYLLDLDSAGGTSVNGHPVGKRPQPLNDGDIVEFAGVLSYRIELGSGFGVTIPHAAPVFVRLQPIRSDGAGEQIVLTHFPVLIGRESDFFTLDPGGPRLPLKYLSRRHACLYVKGRALYLEDLGSTNGSWCNGKKLAANSEQRLEDNDEIAFGSERLAYRVQVESEATANAMAIELTEAQMAIPIGQNTSGVVRINNTLYMAVADSFLDIFCDQAQAEQNAGESAPVATERVKGGRLTKAGVFSSELRSALSSGSGKPLVSRFKLVIFASLIFAAVIALGITYFADSERQVQSLLDQQRYQDALLEADAELADNPHNQALNKLAIQALIQTLLPDWRVALEEGRYVTVREQLSALSGPTAQSGDGQKILQLLTWIADLSEFSAERGPTERGPTERGPTERGPTERGPTERGPTERRFSLFSDRELISDLLQRRDAAASEQDLIMAQITDLMPDFRALRIRVDRDVRDLRSDSSVLVPAIDDLHRKVRRGLQAPMSHQLVGELDDFQRRYPQVGGLADLRADVEQFAKLKDGAEQQDLNAIIGLLDQEYLTPWIRQYKDDWSTENLPPENNIAAFSNALSAWRTGASDRAIGLLEPLLETPWGSAVKDVIDHFSTTSNEFISLSELRGKPAYAQKLLAFAKRLQSPLDEYYRSAIGGELASQQILVFDRAVVQIATARGAWDSYQKLGGISGLLRLERRISDAFRERADYLSAAHSAASVGLALYRLADRDPSEIDQTLIAAIEAETRVQRRWLKDLATILRSDLLTSKLAMMPQPETTE